MLLRYTSCQIASGVNLLGHFMPLPRCIIERNTFPVAVTITSTGNNALGRGVARHGPMDLSLHGLWAHAIDTWARSRSILRAACASRFVGMKKHHDYSPFSKNKQNNTAPMIISDNQTEKRTEQKYELPRIPIRSKCSIRIMTTDNIVNTIYFNW